jgi:hypothetical protein
MHRLISNTGQKLSTIVSKALTVKWLAYAFTLLGGLIYFGQVWYYAHTLRADLDEGFYLYEGLLYALGRYRLYQDYGFPANQMPLAYLIPGYVQRWFGPSFLAARYAAILFALLTLLGLWIVARRFGGKWLAMGLVWAMALNPALLKMYSQMSSQVLAASMLAWVMVFVLGERQALWQIIVGSILAGAVVMTRINLLPLIPFLVFYVFWQAGKKAGSWCIVTSLLPMVIFHTIYWPNILKIWALYLPESLTPFLNAWRLPEGAILAWNPATTYGARLESLILTLKSHFVSIVGAVTAWILWPRRKYWKSETHFRASVFVSCLLIALVLLHLWAAIGQNYCVFCLQMYFAFFAELGLLLIALTYHSWRLNIPRLKQIIVYFTIIVIVIGLVFSLRELLYNNYGSWWPFWMSFLSISRPILEMRVPRIRNLEFPGGTTMLQTILSNKFGWSLETQHEIVFRLFTTLIVILILLLFTWLFFLLKNHERRNKFLQPISMGASALFVLLFVGFLLSPSQVLGAHYKDYDCGSNVIEYYELTGRYLSQTLPPGANTYWAVYSPIPLLYALDVNIYPPQVYQDYFKTFGGDPIEVWKYGAWNEELARQWLSEADYVLVDGVDAEVWLRSESLSGAFVEVGHSPPLLPCRNDDYIYVFRRVP